MNEEERMGRIRAILKTLPIKPGVYLMHDETGKVIYVGKAKKLKRRVSSYFNHRDFAIPRLRKLVQTVCDISFIRTETEAEAFIVESRLIKAIQPFFNVELKMGSRYPFIVVTSERFPRVLVTHTRPKSGRVFGPYTSAGNMRGMLDMIRRFFPLRNCTKDLSKDKLIRPCLMYDVGKCLGPCGGKCTEKEYNETVDDILLLLNGQTADLVSRLRSRMEKLAKELKFEEAAKARDTIRNLWRFSRQKLSVTLTDELDEDTWTAMTRLRDLIGLPVVPWRIDGFDISHSSGHETYGVAVVFEQGYPNQSLYRRYAIRTVEGIDDFRSMRETVLRRYRGMIENQQPLPQLIMIDGGPEQLAFAREALAEVPVKIATVALAKRDELIFTEPDKPPLRLDWNDPALRLLQRVRDESHRFAITTHRHKRVSRLSRSSLEDIPGVGKHTAAALLSTFGSVQRVASLTPDELQKAPGIGPKQAARIAAFLAGLNGAAEGAASEAAQPARSAAEIVAASQQKTAHAKYHWNETIDVPYQEQLPEWRELPENAGGEEREDKPDLAKLLGVKRVRRTYDPKRKRGIHRA
ncbi:MAG: excinuclease ABC subunit UvrC [Pyramidobacter sp.]|nr:excinuclease ABC subunit UvrC [Pyramidobacter sp.]MBP3751162.1 excinuclease ABC subunit UvrC [Pyramidobacter sp.]